MTLVPPPLNDALSAVITEDDIANYLSNTPDFFQRHAELLAAVQLTSPHSQRAVSLQERQAELLREKIKGLEQRTVDMLRNGAENVLLSDKIMRWACTLLQDHQPQGLPERLAQSVAQTFAVPQVALRVWDVAPAFADAPCTQGVSADVRVFTASLSVPFCGLNTGFESVAWLAQPQAVASVALVPLRWPAQGDTPGSTCGLLVLGSEDAQRFDSAMATDFLLRIGELAVAALSRLR